MYEIRIRFDSKPWWVMFGKQFWNNFLLLLYFEAYFTFVCVNSSSAWTSNRTSWKRMIIANINNINIGYHLWGQILKNWVNILLAIKVRKFLLLCQILLQCRLKILFQNFGNTTRWFLMATIKEEITRTTLIFSPCNKAAYHGRWAAT